MLKKRTRITQIKRIKISDNFCAASLSGFLYMLAPASPTANESFSYFPKGDPGTTANESLRDAFGIQCPLPDLAKFLTPNS